MKRLLIAIAIILTLPLSANGPKSWSKAGTATDTNAVLLVGGASPFGPNAVCIKNVGGTNDLYFDWTDGIAAATDNSTNLVVKPGDVYCSSGLGQNPTTLMNIGVITAAGVTTSYLINAIAAQ